MRRIVLRWRVASRRRRERELMASLRRRVQLMEFEGALYVALDGMPVVRTYQGGRDMVGQLREVRDTLFAYLSRRN